MKNTFWVYIFIFLLPTGLNAQSFIWSDTVAQTGNHLGFDVVVDASGNTYSGGAFTGAMTLNTLPLATTINSDGGTSDGMVIKYNSAGIPQWVAKIGGTVTPRLEEVTGIDVDASGNVYVCGYSRSSQVIFYGNGNPNITLVNTGNDDSFVAKYDNNGNLLWAVRPSATNFDRAYGIKVDDTDVYVTGGFRGSINFLGGIGTTLVNIVGASTDGYIAKYAQSNGAISWVKRISGTNNQEALSIDELGNDIYVCGYSNNASATFQGTPNITITTTGSDDGFLTKIDKTLGNASWVLKIGSTAADRAQDVSVKPGSVWVTGYFTTQLRTFTTAQVLIANTASAGLQDVFLLEYDLNGTLLRTIREGGTGADYGSGIDDDANGDIFACGVFSGTVSFGGGPAFVSAGLRDCFLAKYNSNGTFNSMNHISSASEDSIATVSINGYVGSVVGFYNGASLSIQTINPSPVNPWVNLDDYFVAHFSVCLTTPITNNIISANQSFCAGVAPSLITGLFPLGGNGIFSYVWEQSPDNINWENASGVNNLLNYQPPATNYLKYYRRKIVSSCLPPNYSNVITLNTDYSYPEWNVPAPVCDDGSPLNLSTLLVPLTSGSAQTVISNNGITNPANILNSVDGLYADFYDPADEIVIDFGDTIPLGRTIEIIWRQLPGQSGTSGFRVYESVDNFVFNMNTNGPWLTSIENWFTTTIILQSATRYIRIQEATAGFEIDAVTYSYQGTSGGTWSGTGVSGGNFDPAIGSSGSYNVTYTHAAPGCVVNSVHQIIVLCCSGPSMTCPVNRNEYANSSCQFSIPNYIPLTTIIDRCGTGLTNTQTPAAGTLVGLGVTTIKIKSVDGTGNADSCTFNITVLDTIAPLLTCPSTQNELPNASCDFILPDYYPLLGGVSDNCSPFAAITYMQSPVSGSMISASSVITLTAIDAYGNDRSCVFQVNLIDLTPPTITCPPAINVNNSPGLCGANLVLTPPVVADSCGVTSLLNNFNGTSNASGFYPVGTTTVIWTAMDAAGNSSTCNQSITVNDTQNPSITCPSNIVISTSPGLCNRNVVIPVPVVSDNCGITSLINDINGTSNASGVYAEGIHTINWTVVDVNGLSNTCAITVTVQDLELPAITCSSNLTVSTDLNQCTASLLLAVPLNSDNCGVASLLNTFNGTGNSSGTYPQGITNVTWNIVDVNGNANSCSMSVTVNDNQAPSISCIGNQNVNASLFCNHVLADYRPLITSSDNCTPTGSLTITQVPAAGTTITANTLVTITSTDLSGNSSVCTFTVILNDITSPTVTCPANTNVFVNAACQFSIPNYIGLLSASDNCDPSLTIVQNPVSGTILSGAGTVQVISFVVTDDAGNSANCSFNITLVDNQAPAITCPSNVTSGTDLNLCSANLIIATPVVSDNCGIASVTNNFNFGSNASGVYPTGVTNVNWSVIDINGNSNTCAMSVTVNDNQAPTISCLGNQNVNASLSCNYVLTDYRPLITSSDNCTPVGSLTITQVPAAGTTITVNTLVTITSTDLSGNSSVCTFTVIINDVTPPTVTCPSNTNVFVNAFCQFVVPNYTGLLFTSDNCDPSLTVIQSPVTGTVINGSGIVQTISFIVTDDAGNSTNCSFDITLIDNQAPGITCPGNVNSTANLNLCTANLIIPAPVVSDNCGVASVINNFNSSANASGVYPVGITSVNWIVQDDAGNNNTCVMSVTVTDNQAPSISCLGNQNVNASAFCNYVLTDYRPLITTSDNCTPFGSLVITQSPAAGTVITANTVITITSSDLSGNIATCIFTVYLNDVTAPTVSCPVNRIENVDATCKFTIPNYQSLITVSDNCDPSLTIVQSPIAGTVIYNDGTTQTISFLVTDDAGNSSSCSFVITLNDILTPTIVCPANISVGTGLNLCTANVTVPIPVVADNCGVLSTINSFNSTSNASGIYPAGITNVNWTVTDINGNNNTCSMTVTVTDNQIPTLVCIGNQNVNASPSCDNVLANYIPLITTTDNCTPSASLIVTQSPVAGTVITANTLVTITSTDALGNTNSCSFTVNLIDATPPSVTCPANTTAFVDVNCNYVIPDYSSLLTISDNCDASPSITQSPVAGTIISGGGTVQAINFSITDASGNDASCSFNLTLIDNSVPLITCSSSVTVNNFPSLCAASVTLPSPVVSDNCGLLSVINSFNSTSNSSGNYPVGLTNVIWTATDLSGNTNTCSMNVTVLDNQAPTIVCLPSQNVIVTSACDYTLTNYLSSIVINDNCTPVGSLIISQFPAAGTVISSNTNITITATDASGNTGTCTFTVILNDGTPPTITCPIDMNVYVNSSCQYVVPNLSGLLTVNDNCDSSPNISQNPAIGSVLSGSGTLQTVTFTVTDASGNSSLCSFDITLIDTISPVIICPSSLASCAANVSWPNPVVTDNCGVLSWTQTAGQTSGSVFTVGTHVIGYEVFDISGNNTSCSFTVTINSTINTTFFVDDTICFGAAPINLNDSTVIVGLENNYFFGPGLALSGPPINNILSPASMPSGNYVVTHVVDNGSCSDSTSLSFVILPQMNSTFNNPDTVCAANISFDLPMLYTGSTITGGIWSGTNVVDSTWYLSGLNGNYSITYIAILGLCTDTTTHSIFVYQDLDTSWTPTTICVSEPLFDLSTLVTGTSGGTFTGPGITSSMLDPSVLGPGTFFATYNVGLPICAESNTQVITILDLPEVDAGLDQDVCGFVAQLDASGSTSNGIWTLPSSMSITPSLNDSTGTITSTQYGSDTLVWTIDLMGICSNSDTVIITFYETIAADAGPDQSLSFILEANLNATPPIQGSGNWTNGNNSPTIWTPSSETSFVDDLTIGDNLFVWTVSNGPCQTSDVMNVYVKDLFVPQAITPNGDGVNDYLLIGGLGDYIEHHLEIFNRWGQLIYESNNYQSDWDGRTSSGDLLPNDTYFYTLTVAGKLNYSGFFVIKR